MANIINLNAVANTLAVTTASANVLLSNKGSYAVITNTGTVPAFVASGGASVTASATTNICVPAGGQCTFTINRADAYIAGICATGTTSLNIAIGDGI